MAATDRPADRDPQLGGSERGESELAVALSDLAVGIVALGALRWVRAPDASPAPARPRQRAIRRAFGLFFGSVAVASLSGALLHGLFADRRAGGRRVLWRVSLAAIGLSAAAAVDAAAGLSLGHRAGAVARWAAAAGLAAWLGVVALATVPYRAAIAVYAPAIVVFGGALASRVGAPRERSAAVAGLAGLGLTILAAAVQLGRVRVGRDSWVARVGRVGIGRNTLYHAIQAAGVAVLGWSARGFRRALDET